MLRRKALIRRLSAVETLGSVNVICSDKTGTLTENRMRVTEIVSPRRKLLLTAAALCNDAQRGREGWLGDPTEVALMEAAQAEGLVPEDLAREHPRVGEIPFSSERKRMVTIHEWAGGRAAFVKGAFDVMKTLCANVPPGAVHAHDGMAGRGMRVLAFGWKPEPGGDPDRDLQWLGLIGMHDPPRAEVKEAIELCRTAGIRAVMITGDHPLTAHHIAAQIGIPEDEVYARVSPGHKLEIVEAMRAKGHVVAMTGDGVNDAPALKRAHVGIAMSEGGTDVAREASDIVLLDNNFATIVDAVREGRGIYDNLRKFVLFLITCNSGELWVMLLGPLLGMPLPLLPLQILWMNLVTDGPPALALGVDPIEPGVMRRPPRPVGESILGGGMAWRAFWLGALLGFVSLAIGAWWWVAGRDTWQTMIFTVLTGSQLTLALGMRSERESVWALGVFGNRPLVAAMAGAFLLQLGLIYLPFPQNLFGTKSLSPQELLVCCLASLIGLVVLEAAKRYDR
jgi:Ca2+-transporting ATPase